MGYPEHTRDPDDGQAASRPRPKPAMSPRELIGRTLYLVEWERGLTDAGSFEDWVDGNAYEVDDFFRAMELVLMPPGKVN